MFLFIQDIARSTREEHLRCVKNNNINFANTSTTMKFQE